MKDWLVYYKRTDAGDRAEESVYYAWLTKADSAADAIAKVASARGITKSALAADDVEVIP